MPDIKNQFTGGKMNKDLDERIVPKGEYRDAMNIQVSTSEDSDVGAAQNILGNIQGCVYGSILDNPILEKSTTVSSISDEKNDSLYWLVAGPTDADFDVLSLDAQHQTVSFKDLIMRTNSDTSIAPSGCEPVFVDKWKYCTLLTPATVSTLTNSIVFDDTSLYSNIIPGMQATGFSNGASVFGPRLVTNVGTLNFIPINYQSNTVTNLINVTDTSSQLSVPVYLRTFAGCAATFLGPGQPNPNFYNSITGPGFHAGNASLCPPHQADLLNIPQPTNIASNTQNLQLLIPMQTPAGQQVSLPGSFVVGAEIDFAQSTSGGSPVGFNIFTSSTIVSITPNVTLDPTYAAFSATYGSGPTSFVDYYVIEVDTGPQVVDTTQLIPDTTHYPSQVHNFQPLYIEVTSQVNQNVPGSSIEVYANSQQWLNEIYEIFYQPGTILPVSGATPSIVIDNSVGAGGLFPPNSCIDPGSIIDPTYGFSLGPPIQYNTTYDIVDCNTYAPVTPSNFNNFRSLPLTFFVQNQFAPNAVYLNATVELKDVDTICFENPRRVLNFDASRLITGINIVDDMLFWTDNFTEPKK